MSQFPRSPHGPRRWFRTVSSLSAVALVVGLTACGEDDSDADSTPQATETTEVPAADSTIRVVDGVPDDQVADGFVERIVYPVRDGEPDLTQNWADFYLPGGGDDELAEDSVPLVVFIHGGAWHGGAPGSRNIASDLTDRGMAVLNVEYRDISEGGGWPQTFTDVADALDYVPQIDKRFPEITIDDETVVGHSAGGQLAAWAGTRGDLLTGDLGADPKFTPTRVVSLSGPLDLVWSAEHGDDNIVTALDGTPSEVPEKYDSVDPAQNINRHLPVVAVHGTKDTLVPPETSERYVDRVTREGGDAKMVKLADEDHTSFLKRDSRHYTSVLDIIHDVSDLSREELGNRLDGDTTELAEAPQQ